MSDDDATAVFEGRLLRIAGRQNVLVAGPRGAIRGRERVRLRFPERVFPVLDAGTILQRVALRSRFALDT